MKIGDKQGTSAAPHSDGQARTGHVDQVRGREPLPPPPSPAGQQPARRATTGPDGRPIDIRTPTGAGTPSGDRRIPVAGGVSIDAATGLPMIGETVPGDWATLGDNLYEVASVIDRMKDGNLFAQVPLNQRQKLLDALSGIVDGTTFENKPTDALTADQAAQLRSSVATTLRHLMSSLIADARPQAQPMLGSAVELLVRQARGEQHRALRESMAFGIYRYHEDLPAELQARAADILREIAPLELPYEKWLEDGKVVLDLVFGDSASYRLRAVERVLDRLGIERVDGNGSHGTFRGTVGRGDKEIEVEVRMRIKSGNDIFANGGRDGIDIVLYTGHSSYGRNLPKSLANAGEATGEGQLFWIETCFGKANFDQMRRAFPGAQIMTTFYSASSSGDFAPGLRHILEGLAQRSDWETMDRRLNSNTITPIQVMENRRILDRDGDGRADIFDRLFDVNLHHVERDLRNGLRPRDPGAPPHRLQALYGVVAANWMNRGAGAYNEAVKNLNRDSRVWSSGFFAGKQGEAPVRIEKTTLEDGNKGWSMAINHNYAHMPEELVRVVASHEFNTFLSKTESGYDYRGDALRTNVNSLLLVAFTLGHDMSWNDATAWDGFLKAYGFPPELELNEMERFAEMNGASDRDAHGGSRRNIDAFIEHLQSDKPELLRALSADGVGQWRGLD